MGRWVRWPMGPRVHGPMGPWVQGSMGILTQSPAVVPSPATSDAQLGDSRFRKSVAYGWRRVWTPVSGPRAPGPGGRVSRGTQIIAGVCLRKTPQNRRLFRRKHLKIGVCFEENTSKSEFLSRNTLQHRRVFRGNHLKLGDVFEETTSKSTFCSSANGSKGPCVYGPMGPWVQGLDEMEKKIPNEEKQL